MPKRALLLLKPFISSCQRFHARNINRVSRKRKGHAGSKNIIPLAQAKTCVKLFQNPSFQFKNFRKSFEKLFCVKICVQTRSFLSATCMIKFWLTLSEPILILCQQSYLYFEIQSVNHCVFPRVSFTTVHRTWTQESERRSLWLGSFTCPYRELSTFSDWRCTSHCRRYSNVVFFFGGGFGKMILCDQSRLVECSRLLWDGLVMHPFSHVSRSRPVSFGLMEIPGPNLLLSKTWCSPVLACSRRLFTAPGSITTPAQTPTVIPVCTAPRPHPTQ